MERILRQPKPITDNDNSLSRREFTEKLILGGTVAALGGYILYRGAAADSLPVPQLNPNAYGSEAILAHTKLQQAYVVNERRKRGLYLDTFPAYDEDYAEAWPFARAQGAAVHALSLAEAGDFERSVIDQSFKALAHYKLDINGRIAYNAHALPSKKNIDVYNDDQAWILLNALGTFFSTGDEEKLKMAKECFEFISGNWRTGQKCADGGITWNLKGKDRNTVSNSPVAKAGFRLYQITGEESYYSKSKEMFDWVNATLKDKTDGLYWDHINAHCDIQKTKWSYNQGTMIGNNVVLYQITTNPLYLKNAEQIAWASLNHYTQDSAHNLTEHPIEFNVIYFENLFLLSSQTTDPQLKSYIRNTAEIYTQSIWPEFFANRSRTYNYLDAPRKVISQGAIVDMIALLGLNPSTYAKL